MKKIKLGDVFEFETGLGKVYLHYVFQDQNIGELVRVLEGFYDETPPDIDALVKTPERFFIFFPLAAAQRKKIVTKVGDTELVEGICPKFMLDPHIIQDEFLGWHIVDTSTWQRRLVKELSEEEKRLSPWGVWNDTLLREQLEVGWNLEKWTKDPFSL
jgi:hypothetical protein